MPATDPLSAQLRPCAATADNSRGREHQEQPPQYRGEFQRDRDRIIHCSAFRRLEYKTQVFVNHEGDMFRTRLTHSLEVAQIARSIARAMGLNEDLSEAIALAHDLGHTPFGHAGQAALNRCMREYGGFEHNLQSLRVVSMLEHRYAAFRGLNLSFESKEGILKHCSGEHAQRLGDLGQRFLHGGQPGLEAQLANIADEIAYNNHDIDDGLRSGLIQREQLMQVPIVARHFSALKQRHAALDDKLLLHETIRTLINEQVSDLIVTSCAAIDAAKPDSIEAVRAQPQPLIRFSDAMQQQIKALKQFLHRHLYRHYRVIRMNAKADRIISALFEVFMDSPRLLPPDAQAHIEFLQSSGEHQEQQQQALADFSSAAPSTSRYAILGRETDCQARAIADYIAGMTDRYAIVEYRRIFDPQELT